MKLRGGALGLACFAVVVALTACTPSSGQTTSSPTPSTSASSTPTPAATEGPPQAATIVVSSSAMQVLDEEGALLREFSYFEPVEEVAAELAELTGVEPTIAPYAGGGDTPPGTSYDWGSITIRNGWPMQDPFYPDYHAFVTGTTVGPLDIAAIGGLAIGDDFDAVAAAHPFSDPTLLGYASLDTLDLPENPDFPRVQLTFSVLVLGDANGGQVTRMIAPSSNWGA